VLQRHRKRKREREEPGHTQSILGERDAGAPLAPGGPRRCAQHATAPWPFAAAPAGWLGPFPWPFATPVRCGVLYCVTACFSVLQSVARGHASGLSGSNRSLSISLSLVLSLSLARALSVSLSFSLDCLGLFELWCCTIPHSTFDTGAPVSKRPRQSSTCVSRYCATLELLV